jgi:hypothetical protein
MLACLCGLSGQGQGAGITFLVVDVVDAVRAFTRDSPMVIDIAIVVARFLRIFGRQQAGMPS